MRIIEIGKKVKAKATKIGRKAKGIRDKIRNKTRGNSNKKPAAASTQTLTI